MTLAQALKLAAFPPTANLTDLDKLALIQKDYFIQHLDVFIEYAFPEIHLSRDQKVIARAFGRAHNIKVVMNRGGGKTWLIALCCFALCCLEPGTPVIVISKTVPQAVETLVKLAKIAEFSPSFANEIDKGAARTLVQITKDGASVRLKNGSTIETRSINSARGIRAKILVRDEEVELDQDLIRPIVMPITNYTRDICISLGIKDFPSKNVSITSCCEQAHPFYDEFMQTYNSFREGKPGYFACCLDYNASIANGVNQAEYFEEVRSNYPADQFMLEFGSVFLGSVRGTVLPYTLTDPVRVLDRVELAQPKSSKARYVIGLDIATSAAKGADNSIIVVMKFHELQSGLFARKLVFMQSFHGEKLDSLAKRIQELYFLRFPNTEKIVYDARGVGDAFSRFCNNEFIDPATGREYPPLVVDDEPNYNSSAIVALHPFRAVLSLNQRLYSNLILTLEKRTIELPVSSRNLSSAQQRPMEERAIFIETDALQREMSHIVRKEGARGVTYDTPSAAFHKDRYSALAMANDYISEMEKENLKYMNLQPCLGVCSNF